MLTENQEPVLSFTSSQYITLPAFTVAAPNSLVVASLSVSFWIKLTSNPTGSSSTPSYIFRYSNSGVINPVRASFKVSIVEYRSICFKSDLLTDPPYVCGKRVISIIILPRGIFFWANSQHLGFTYDKLGLQNCVFKLQLLLFSLFKWPIVQCKLHLRPQFLYKLLCSNRSGSIWRLCWTTRCHTNL